MFWKKKSPEESQQRRDKALAGYKERVAKALTIVDPAAKQSALRKLNREIERKFVQTGKVARRAWAIKYGFVIAAPPMIAAMTAVLFSFISYAAFAVSMTVAWISGIRAIKKAERPPSELPYKVYQARKESESQPFRALQKEIAAHFNTRAPTGKAAKSPKPGETPQPLRNKAG